ncbi:MAG: DUF354 domain-containing protein [Asgard group archaeon]|nr:DUF354 domain-containing protein [Asgard group archaeon]
MVESKVIWFEVLTPKQAMLFLAFGEKLKKFGIDSIYTTRKHDYIADIFKHRKITPATFGKYGGKSLEGKLIASAKRVVELAEFIADYKPKPLVTISFSSPDAARVAFGLGIPLILLNDTAHSIPVARLTFSLARYLITPTCINKEDFIRLGAQPDIIHQYAGVDEVEYITIENYKLFSKKREESKEERYLIFRPEESFAAYMKDKDSKPYLEILEEAVKHYSGKILVFPRYEAQKEILQEKFEDKIIIPKDGYHFLELYSNADVLITGGGTMARESALLGIPSITYFWRHLEPQKFIEEKGFPSYSTQTIPETKKIIKKICSNPKKYFVNTLGLLPELEKPSSKILSLLKNDDQFKDCFV